MMMLPGSLLVMVFILVPDFVLLQNCPQPCECISTTVYCNMTGITNVPSDLPINTETLYIGNNPIKFVAKTAFVGLDKLAWLDFSGNNFKESSIEKGALNIPSLLVLDLTQNSFITIPQELPPNLIRIYFYYNPITTLKATSFVNHSTIQFLYLDNTQLNKIEDHAFDPLVNAVEIDLAFNKLVDGSFGPMTFVKNQKLINLGFRFNNLKTIPDTSNFPVSLQSLDFVGNKIKIIPAYAFRTLTNLTSMAFWQGEINDIENNAFYGLHKLSYLDMMQDHVSSITNLTFNGLTALQNVFLDLNNISKIEPGAFQSTRSIQQLWLGSNKLTSLVPEVLNKTFVPQLSALFIDDNPWICDCHLRWLRQKMDDEPNVIQDPHLIVCSGPPKVAGKAWDSLQPNDFVCVDRKINTSTV